MPRRTLLFALLLASCSTNVVARTEILLSVSADADVQHDLTSLRIHIDGGAPGAVRMQTYEEDVPRASLHWPVELAILPQGGDATRSFDVEVTALAMGTPLVVARASTSFLAGETRVLEIHLASACRNITCPMMQTCNGGACATVHPIDPHTLAVYGTSSDAGPPRDGMPPPPRDGCTPVTVHADADGDGYGNPASTATACVGAGYVLDGTDCDDTCSACHPGAAEQCGGADEDCDGMTDETAGADAWCSDPANLPPNAASATCVAGACAVASCGGGYLDCGAAAGCETNGASDAANCGACGHACEAGTPCSASVCDGEIATGRYHTCARRGGAVACWGANDSGQLGDGTVTSRGTPAPVPGITDATQITAAHAGYDNCALRVGGTVVCWGFNAQGQVGDGTTTNQLSPVPVAGLSSVVEVAAGNDHTCARISSGTVSCWGANNWGQLGDGTTTDRPTPGAVSGLTDAIQIAVGDEHACALRADHTAVCWGQDGYGQLGNDATLLDSHSPVPVAGLSGVAMLAAGGRHTCALRMDGSVVCWGQGGFGTLGVGSTADSAVPAASVTGLTDAAQISAAYGYTCALRSGGSVVCWGYNGYGNLGDGSMTDRSLATPVTGLLDAISISTGDDHACARRPSSTVCWGSDSWGGLGDGGTTTALVPVTVIAP